VLPKAIQTFSLAQKQFCWSGIGVRTTASADRNMAAHRHSFFQVFFVAAGSAVHEIAGRVFEAGPGSIFFVSPYTVHRVVFPSDAECYVIYFNGEFLHRSFGVTEVSGQDANLFRLPEVAPFVYQQFCSYRLDEAENAQARERCLRIEQACRLRGFFDAAQARAELVLLLTSVGKKYSEEFARIEKSGGSEAFVDRRARDAIEFLRKNFMRPLSLGEVAAKVNLTGTYLTHLLKHETGKTFKQLLDELRLEHAKNLLAYTDTAMQRIAAESGFLDQAHFARRFKAYAHVTPGQFRRTFHSPLDEGELVPDGGIGVGVGEDLLQA
jgi:AraC-like DNA-binding protein